MRREVTRRVVAGFFAVLLVLGLGAAPVQAGSVYDEPGTSPSETEPPPGEDPPGLVPGPPEDREPTPEEKKEAAKLARLATGEKLCHPISWALPKRGEEQCWSLAGAAFTPEGKKVTAKLVCDNILSMGGIPLTSWACEQAIKGTMNTAQVVFDDTYRAEVLRLVEERLGPITEVIDFIRDPSGSLDELANSMKEATYSLVTWVFDRMLDSSAVELDAMWFTTYYAGAAVIGFAVLVLMVLLLAWQVSRGKMDRQELADWLVVRGPLAAIAIVFAPPIGHFITWVTDSMARGIADEASWEMTRFLTESFTAMLMSLTATMVPGGAIVGIIVFLLMILGALGVWFGLLMQSYMMYMVAIALAIGLGMSAHPTWQSKSRKMTAFWVSLALMKPMIILLLTISFGFLNSLGSRDPFVDLVTVAMVLVILGFSPWVILKYAPLLPNGNEHSQSPGGSTMPALAGAAGGVFSAMMMQRYYANQAGGGSGPGGPGGDTSSPGGWRSRGESPSTGADGPGGDAADGGDGPGSGGPQVRDGGNESGVPNAKPGDGAGGGDGQGGDGAGGGDGVENAGPPTGQPIPGAPPAPGESGGSGGGAGAGGSAGAGGAGGAAGAAKGGGAGPLIAAQAAIAVGNAAIQKGQQTARDADPEMKDGDD